MTLEPTRTKEMRVLYAGEPATLKIDSAGGLWVTLDKSRGIQAAARAEDIVRIIPAEFQDRTPDGLVWTPALSEDAAREAAEFLQTEYRVTRPTEQAR